MQFCEAYRWISDEERRTLVVTCMTQPLTATQLSHRTKLTLRACTHLLSELTTHGVVSCLNPSAVRSRVHWLTKHGKVCQQQLRKDHVLAPIAYDFPNVDWRLYGWICSSHRAAVLKALRRHHPLQPLEIRRRARSQDLKLRMNTSNVRDVIQLFLAKGIVRAVRIRGKHHPRFELTEIGETLGGLMLRAEVAP